MERRRHVDRGLDQRVLAVRRGDQRVEHLVPRHRRRVIVVPAVALIAVVRVVVVRLDGVDLDPQLLVVRREEVERGLGGGGVEHVHALRAKERRIGIADAELAGLVLAERLAELVGELARHRDLVGGVRLRHADDRDAVVRLDDLGARELRLDRDRAVVELVGVERVVERERKRHARPALATPPTCSQLEDQRLVGLERLGLVGSREVRALGRRRALAIRHRDRRSLRQLGRGAETRPSARPGRPSSRHRRALPPACSWRSHRRSAPRSRPACYRRSRAGARAPPRGRCAGRSERTSARRGAVRRRGDRTPRLSAAASRT